MKNAVELIESLIYKLRMFGVPVEGPMNIFCDNKAFYKNTSLPESVLKKARHSIAYHRCHEAVAAETVCVAKEGTRTNLSDLFTNCCRRLRATNYLIGSHINGAVELTTVVPLSSQGDQAKYTIQCGIGGIIRYLTGMIHPMVHTVLHSLTCLCQQPHTCY